MKVNAFLRHWWEAGNASYPDTPLFRALQAQVLPHAPSEIGAHIEQFRRQLSRSQEPITFPDFGAGANERGGGTKQTTLGRLAHRSARYRREGELLFRLCQHFQPQTCLELGTNLGISAMYQLAGLANSRFISLEGAPSLADRARAHCLAVVGKSPEIWVGEFGETLPKVREENLALDYAFIDGNHRYQATLDYFHFLHPLAQPGALFVFDDISWSKGMRQAWEEIVQHPAVTLSLDLFTMGVCWLGLDHPPGNYRVRFRPR